MSRPNAPIAVFYALALFGLARPSSAQENLTFHSCTAYIGGGDGRILGNDSADLNHWGGIFQAGGGFGITPAFALIFDFQYQQTRVNQAGLNSQSTPPPNAGSVRFENVTMEPTFVLLAKKWVNVYTFAGFGWLQRSVKFTDSGGTFTHPGAFRRPVGQPTTPARSHRRRR